jgi:hypothetical protein
MKSKPNRNLDAAARNKIFVLSRTKAGVAAKTRHIRRDRNIRLRPAK